MDSNIDAIKKHYLRGRQDVREKIHCLDRLRDRLYINFIFQMTTLYKVNQSMINIDYIVAASTLFEAKLSKKEKCVSLPLRRWC